MKMQLKKETKHTCVYQVNEMELHPDQVVAVDTVYVSKAFLRQHLVNGGWPAAISLEVKASAE